MNVTIDAMHATPASRALWWFSLAAVVCGGLAMRLLTIDRGTPAIGVFVYFGLLAVMFTLIALPGSVVAAIVWHKTDSVAWLARLKRIGGDARARWIVIACVVVATILIASAGRRLPPWHVWMSLACFNALIAWRVFALALTALRNDADQSKHAPQRSYERIDTAMQTKPTRFASEDRNAREHWRNRPLALRIRQQR